MSLKPNKFAEIVWPWLLITFGAVLAASGYVIFILPLDMIEGGVTGIGIIAQHLTGLPIVGTTSIAITSLVFIFAARIMGGSFGARSIYAMILMNVLIDLFLIIKIHKVTDDILLGSFYGGAVVGVGLGLIYFSGGSTGGADATAQILWKLKKIPMGRTMLIIDFFVLGAATLIFIPLEKIMYSLIFIFVEIKAIDMILNGVQTNQRVMIVTDKPDEIKDAIFDRLNRGLTVFKGSGGYTGIERYMLTTVLPRKDVPEVRRIIAAHDQKAFVIIHDVHQVYGEGFEPLPQKKDQKEFRHTIVHLSDKQPDS